jgi:hypothetical protein
MKRPIYLFIVISLLLGLQPPLAVFAQETSPEPDSGEVLCPLGIYFESPDDCAPFGPSQTLTEMARMGLDYPLQPLPATAPDANLNYVPYNYYEITEYSSNYYPSLNAAQDKRGAIRAIGPGEKIYLTYIDVVEGNRGTFFQNAAGEWFPGDGRRVSVASFQGLEFFATPRHPFGWLLQDAEVRNEPLMHANIPASHTLRRNALVTVYQTISVEGVEWHMIGLDEWVEARFVGVVFPNTAPPEAVANGRWIDVNLAEQTLAVYDNHKLVFATLIASGLDPFWTRPGLFQIYKKKETENMSGSFEADRSDYYYLENVPYTMYFDKARAIHGAYWLTSTFLGYPRSHGCVNMSIGDAAWVYRWAQEGDWVHVYDPSGITPTDPAIYGDGGA